MAFEKRYTAKQVAEAVMAKTQELLAKSELAKKYEGFKAVEASAAKHGAKDPAAVAAAIGREKYGKEAFQHAAAAGKKMGKSDDMEKCGTFSKVHAAARREGYSEESADKIAGKAKAMEKAENSKKENAKPSEHGAKEQDQPANGPAPKGEIHPKEHVEGKSDDVRHTPNPEANPKEQAEGNNELAGTTPTQVGQDGKNIPGGDEIKGHLKLAKFIGHMESKRKHRGIPNG